MFYYNNAYYNKILVYYILGCLMRDKNLFVIMAKKRLYRLAYILIGYDLINTFFKTNFYGKKINQV